MDTGEYIYCASINFLNGSSLQIYFIHWQNLLLKVQLAGVTD